MDPNRLGQKIRNFRLRLGLSQFKLEELIDASPGSISRIENGDVNPTKETLLKIMEVLQLSSKEGASLFGIEVEDKSLSIAKLTANLYKSQNIDELLQKSVDDIVFELGLLSAFVALQDGDKLYARATTNNMISKQGLRLIGKSLTSLNVSITHDRNNLLVKAFNEKTPQVDYQLKDFIVPAVNEKLALILEKLSRAKASLAVPIINDGKSIGCIFFCKNYKDDFRDEIAILTVFADLIGIAIVNNQKE